MLFWAGGGPCCSSEARPGGVLRFPHYLSRDTRPSFQLSICRKMFADSHMLRKTLNSLKKDFRIIVQYYFNITGILVALSSRDNPSNKNNN